MTENTGWGPGPGEVSDFPPPAPAPPAAPPVPTAEQQAEAAAQIAAQNVGITGPQVGSPVDLGMAALAAGAEAADPDPGEMLRAIRQLQARIDSLEAEKRSQHAPDVVKYAQALLDHITAKRDQHPVIQADPDHSFGQVPNADGVGGRGVLGGVSHLVASATTAAETGDPRSVLSELGPVETWVKRHARRFPHLDYNYILELAEDVGLAAAKLSPVLA
jgi:hypothetical protein